MHCLLQSQALLAVVGEEVAEACYVLVRQLRGITATYRMTSKGPPTRHSHYVTSMCILRPPSLAV